jgi:hypothetical protein
LNQQSTLDTQSDNNSTTTTTTTATTNKEQNTKRQLYKDKIDEYGIVNICASDTCERPVILFSACNLPEANAILESDIFDSHQHFFDVLLE